MSRMLDKFEAKHEKGELPDFGPGDTIRVYVRVVEGDKVRSQMFQGVVINRRGSSTRATFTVRKVTDGIGVERIFPVHSPSISKITALHKQLPRIIRDLPPPAGEATSSEPPTREPTGILPASRGNLHATAALDRGARDPDGYVVALASSYGDVG